MLAAEHGADYVMFGEPNDAVTARRSMPSSSVSSWWAEVFQMPCVGYAAACDEVAPLAAAGADFIALGDFVLSDPAARGCVSPRPSQRIAAPEPVA